MKRFLSILITLVILAGLTYAITLFTNSKFIDYSFVVGIVVTIIIWFFTSKGGFTSNHVDRIVQGSTGIKAQQQKYEFTPKAAFFTSLVYTIISFISVLIYYKDYFN